MQWEDALADATLADLPYKIEMNEWGKLEMSPASNFHRALQAEILILLRSLSQTGKSYPEISIETAKNVKVADVIWASHEFLASHGLQTPYRVAPEICVEVASPSNSEEELTIKKDLYLDKGAVEVWICSETGHLRFFGRTGQLDNSRLFPEFPQEIRP